MTKLFLSGLILSVFTAILLYFAREKTFTEKALTACLPVALYLVISNLFVVLLEGFGVWDAARLVPTFAYYKDIQVYSSIQHGSVQTTMYPPVWVLSYLPIVLFKSPTTLIMSGYFLSQIYSLFPVLLLFILCSPDKRSAFILFAIFIFTALNLPSLRYSCFSPHADAPSLGFALLAFILLPKFRGKMRIYASFFSILSLVMGFFAVCSKQVMFAIVPALLVCTFIFRGMKTFMTHCLWALFISLFLGLIFLSLFSPEGMLLNLITIPIKVQWTGTFPWNFFSVILKLLQQCSIMIIFMLAGSIFILCEETELSINTFFTKNSWVLLTFLALVFLPASVLGMVKLGGWPNTLSPTIYFLTTALGAQVLEIQKQLSSNPLKTRSHRYFRLFFVSATSFALFLWSFQTAKSFRNVDLARLSTNPTKLAYEYLKSVDSNVYFPTQPLAHIMADGNLYNFSNAVYDRERLAKIPLSAEQRNTHFPNSPSFVCWEDAWGLYYVRSRYFPDYNVRIIVKDLPGFECLKSLDRLNLNLK